MPIVDIQKRFRELGRIRLGEQVKTGRFYESGPRKGQAKTRPTKLPRFRLTSPWPHLIEQAAAVFGGEARPWDNDGAPEFEVIVEVDRLPVVIPPGEVFEQWYELWTGGGCARRCDGVRQVLVDRKCSCPDDPLERQEKAAQGEACKPTSRLRVMIPDVADVGIWRLETHGFHAAAELGGAAGLVEAATRQGAMIPADLVLSAREGSRRPGQPTKKFFVPGISFRGTLGPVLDALGILEAGSEMPVLLGAATGRPALDAGGSPGLPAQTGNGFDPAPVERASFPGPEPAPAPTGPVDEPDPGPSPAVGDPAAFEPPADTAEHEPPVPLEPGPAMDPPAPTPEPGTERAYTGPQVIAMRFDERGVKDRAHRLRLVSYLTGRAIASGNDLRGPEIRLVLEVLNDDQAIAELLEAVPPVAPSAPETDPPSPAWAAPAPSPGPGPAEPESGTGAPIRGELVDRPPPVDDRDPETWSGDQWRAFLRERGVKVVEAMREAARLATEADKRPPGTLDEFAGLGIARLLVGYAEDLRAQRSGT